MLLAHHVAQEQRQCCGQHDSPVPASICSTATPYETAQAAVLSSGLRPLSTGTSTGAAVKGVAEKSPCSHLGPAADLAALLPRSRSPLLPVAQAAACNSAPSSLLCAAGQEFSATFEKSVHCSYPCTLWSCGRLRAHLLDGRQTRTCWGLSELQGRPWLASGGGAQWTVLLCTALNTSRLVGSAATPNGSKSPILPLLAWSPQYPCCRFFCLDQCN